MGKRLTTHCCVSRGLFTLEWTHRATFASTSSVKSAQLRRSWTKLVTPLSTGIHSLYARVSHSRLWCYYNVTHSPVRAWLVRAWVDTSSQVDMDYADSCLTTTEFASTGDLPTVKQTRTTAHRRECEQSRTSTIMNWVSQTTVYCGKHPLCSCIPQ